MSETSTRRILLDQGLAPNAAFILRTNGWDALHVADVGLAQADDIEIMAFAANSGRVCVTLDLDFHAHLALMQAKSPSVVLLRLEGLDSRAQADLIVRVWNECEDAIAAGAALSVGKTSIRVRRLPIS